MFHFGGLVWNNVKFWVDAGKLSRELWSWSAWKEGQLGNWLLVEEASLGAKANCQISGQLGAWWALS